MISAPDEITNSAKIPTRQRVLQRNTSLNRRVGPHPPVVPAKPDSKGQHWLTFVHLGRKNYHITLWASTLLNQRKWYESIVKQQTLMRERSMIFDTVALSQGFFNGPTKVNCAAPFSE